LYHFEIESSENKGYGWWEGKMKSGDVMVVELWERGKFGVEEGISVA
jgi:hypothetical protein